MNLYPAVLQVVVCESDPKQEMPQNCGDQTVKPGHDPEPFFQSCFNVVFGESTFQEPGEDQVRIVDQPSLF